MLVFCALFVFYFNYYVGVLRTICFLLSLLRWCFAQYLFSTFTITLVFCALFFFLLLLLQCSVAHHLFSTFANTLVFCALFVFYFHFYVGVLRTICFLLSLLRWRFAHYFYFYYYVGVLHTIFFLLLLLRWCVAHHLFSTFANTLMFCALFVFYFKYYVVVCALFFFYFHFYVGVLRTICFLLSLLL